MNDLIRREDVLALFPTNDCSDKMIGLYEKVLDVPTAYNVEKVVAGIKEQFGCKDCEYADVSPTPYVCLGECNELEVINDICDIVRKGGVE